jgi:putative Holliday junction resolvase
MRYLGIDYGHKRIGLAVSDESFTLARELKVVSPGDFWRELKTLLLEQEVERIVVGLPLNMSGEQTQKTIEVEQFAERLQSEVSVPVEFVDERLTSQFAKMAHSGPGPIDGLAAQLILQTYLDQNKH